MNDPYLGFDGPAQWGTTIERGYTLEIRPGEDDWLPTITITPRSGDITFYFVRSFDDVGVYTPGYAIPDPAFGVFSVPEQIDVPVWMPVAIERAGFAYDPVPNNERRTVPVGVSVHPEQTRLVRSDQA